MVIVKCKCGCFYTLKKIDNELKKICPNCGTNHKLDDSPTFKTTATTNLETSDIEIQIVPDNAKITVSFNE